MTPWKIIDVDRSSPLSCIKLYTSTPLPGGAGVVFLGGKDVNIDVDQLFCVCVCIFIII